MNDVLHIVVAMKPLDGNFAQNAIKHGVAGLNIDSARIEVNGESLLFSKAAPYASDRVWVVPSTPGIERDQHSQGRWPANVILEKSDDIVSKFPQTTSGAMKKEVDAYDGKSTTGFIRGRSGPSNQHGDSGRASRFFKQVEEYDESTSHSSSNEAD